MDKPSKKKFFNTTKDKLTKYYRLPYLLLYILKPKRLKPNPFHLQTPPNNLIIKPYKVILTN